MMEKITNLINKYNIIWVLISILIAIILYNVIKKIVNNRSIKVLTKTGKPSKKRLTYVKLINSAFKYIIAIIEIVIVMYLLGINVTSVLAGLGIVSVIAGLALQDALKDIIMGFNIVFDEYFNIGDIVTINGITGKVISLGIKNTKVQELVTQNVYAIANRNIGDVLVHSNILDMVISLPYEKKLKELEPALKEIAKKVKDIEEVEESNYVGICKFNDSSIDYKIRVIAPVDNHMSIKGEINTIIKETLDNNNISIPYMQIDIHNVK